MPPEYSPWYGKSGSELRGTSAASAELHVNPKTSRRVKAKKGRCIENSPPSLPYLKLESLGYCGLPRLALQASSISGKTFVFWAAERVQLPPGKCTIGG